MAEPKYCTGWIDLNNTLIRGFVERLINPDDYTSGSSFVRAEAERDGNLTCDEYVDWTKQNIKQTPESLTEAETKGQRLFNNLLFWTSLITKPAEIIPRSGDKEKEMAISYLLHNITALSSDDDRVIVMKMALKHGDPLVRFRAVFFIQHHIPLDRWTELLEIAAKDSDPHVRQIAEKEQAKLPVRLQPTKKTPKEIQAELHERQRKEMVIEQAGIGISYPEGVKKTIKDFIDGNKIELYMPLFKVLMEKNNVEIRKEAVLSIPLFPADMRATMLKMALQDADTGVRKTAALQLKHIPATERKELLELYRSRQSVEKVVTSPLPPPLTTSQRVQKLASSTFLDFDENTARELLSVNRKAGTKALRALLDLKHYRDDSRFTSRSKCNPEGTPWKVAQLLVSIGDREGMDYFFRRAQDMFYCRDEYGKVHAEQALAILVTRGKRSMGYLQRLTSKETFLLSMRIEATKALLQFNQRAGVKAIREISKNHRLDEYDELSLEVAELLLHYDCKAATAILKKLEKSRNADYARKATGLLEIIRRREESKSCQ